MLFKKIGKALLFPHTSLMIILVPIATVFLVYSMAFFGSDSLVSICSYVLSFYTLTVWCIRIPGLIRILKTFKRENKYLRLWQSDARFRISFSLYGTLIWNTAYALLQLGMGFWHRSFWFYSLAGYYIILAVMRFFLVSYTTKHQPGEKMYDELVKYRYCGIAFLVMNMALTLIIFFMVYWDRTFIHHEITTISLAAYTFTAFALAIVNSVKYRKYNSPVYSASKIVSLISATVSILTLEATMLTTFSDGEMNLRERRILLGSSGGVISAFVIIIAVYMITNGTKRLKQLKENENGR